MNPIELSQHPWAVVLVVLSSVGAGLGTIAAGLRILHGSMVRRERALEAMLREKSNAEKALYERMAQSFEATSSAVTERMGELVGLVHANEKARVADAGALERRLVAEFRAAVQSVKIDMLRELRNVRIDLRRGTGLTPSEERAIEDLLNDSSPPEGEGAQAVADFARTRGG